MNIESLQMFCVVVEEGSITEAARKGYVSQPAVTKQIRQLEDRYDALLFHRADNKLILTEAGTVLYPYAKEIVEYYKRSQEAVGNLTGNMDTHLNVGASLTIGEYILPDLLGAFSRKYENIKFNLSIGNTPDILVKLRNNIIDIALVEGIIEDDTNLTIEKFSDDELILVTPYEHRWKDKKEIDIQQLTEEKMIWREPISGTRTIVENALKDEGVFHNIQGFMELGSVQSIKSAVEADLGVSLMPRITVKKELKFGLLREVKINNFHLTRDLFIVQKNHRFRKIGVSNFVSYIKS